MVNTNIVADYHREREDVVFDKIVEHRRGYGPLVDNPVEVAVNGIRR